MIAASAIKVSEFAPVYVMFPLTVMSPVPLPVLVVEIVTEPKPKALINEAMLTVAVSNCTAGSSTVPAVSHVVAGVPVKDPFTSVTATLIVRSVGSSNQFPLLPRVAPVLTKPNACKLFFDEVSINPPFPPSAPPLAKRSP
jgi:hypothetical protein